MGGVNTDLSVQRMPDVDSLVKTMLESDDYPDDATPYVQAEIGLDTDAKAFLKPVVLYSCGAPYQPNANVKAWIWRFTLTLTVLSVNPELAFRTAACINRNVSIWPYRPPVNADAKIGRVLENAGFQRMAPGELTNSKTMHVFVSEKTLQASVRFLH